MGILTRPVFVPKIRSTCCACAWERALGAKSPPYVIRHFLLYTLAWLIFCFALGHMSCITWCDTNSHELVVSRGYDYFLSFYKCACARCSGWIDWLRWLRNVFCSEKISAFLASLGRNSCSIEMLQCRLHMLNCVNYILPFRLLLFFKGRTRKVSHIFAESGD